jgi:ABC-2 type transport system ATP-binding protein
MSPRSVSTRRAATNFGPTSSGSTTTVFLTTHYMDEADRVAHRIAIMDHGKIVAQGTSAELKEQTGTESLEAAFLALTGSSLRDEGADSKDRLRQMAQMFQRR